MATSENRHDVRTRVAREAAAHGDSLAAIAEAALLLCDYAETIAGSLERLTDPNVVEVGPERVVLNPETPRAWKGLAAIPGHRPGRFEFSRAADGVVWIHDHDDRMRYPLDVERAEEF